MAWRRGGGIGMSVAAALVAALTGCADTDTAEPGDTAAPEPLARLHDALVRCWPDPGADDRSQETVSVWFQLDASGQVVNTRVAGSKDPWLAKMQERARRAVVQCQPYDVPAVTDKPPFFTATFPLPRRPAAPGNGEPAPGQD
jgi:hypothetical protein